MARVVEELTATLRKDVSKKMCEHLAFHLFDQWWTEQEAKFKQKQAEVARKGAAAAGPSTAPPPLLPDREKVRDGRIKNNLFMLLKQKLINNVQ